MKKTLTVIFAICMSGCMFANVFRINSSLATSIGSFYEALIQEAILEVLPSSELLVRFDNIQGGERDSNSRYIKVTSKMMQLNQPLKHDTNCPRMLKFIALSWTLAKNERTF